MQILAQLRAKIESTLPTFLEHQIRATSFNNHYCRNLTFWARTSSSRSLAAAASLAERRTSEELWKVFFSDPSQWWDHRSEKRNPKYPDFKHKHTREAIWVTGKWTPAWVESELAALAPGAVQLNIFSWNSILGRYTKDGKCEKTLELFENMQAEGMLPDRYTFVAVVNACAGLRALEEGKRIHSQILQRGLESDVLVGGSLIGMYAKCGCIEKAWRVFNQMPVLDNGAWNAIILGLAKCGQGRRALDVFQRMQMDGFRPDTLTFVGILNACANIGALEEGKGIHYQIIHRGLESRVFVGSSLVNMYAKCGSTDNAWQVFSKMPQRDRAAWNAMIMGYAKGGEGQRALELSRQMQDEGVRPDSISFIAILNACANVGALEEGRRVHAQIAQRGCQHDVFVGSTLLDMYAKCGSIEDARKVFNSMLVLDKVAWSAMIGAYAMHGLAHEAIRLFQVMCSEEIELDNITFVHLLSACSHAGLVDEGLHIFDSMSPVHGRSVTVEQCTCVVDLLGRAGRLQEAEEIVGTISKPDVIVWKALLGACRVHGNMEMGEGIANRVLGLEPENSSGYVLLSNMYAAAGRYDRSESVQEQRMRLGVKKEPGRTWIEVGHQLHSFTVDDDEHPQITEIREELKGLAGQLEAAGFTPDIRFDLRDVEEEEKVSRLSHHSERLAVAFGLMRTSPGTTLRLFKNMRVCGDCHSALKFISEVVNREIVVRDNNRFHHFKDGLCSCGDFW